ncbi:MAG: hypothetical protein AAB354_17065 [candidate division KSB1 bacterium]
MTRQDFEKLRDLPNKKIASDISFEKKKETAPNFIFEQVPLENSLGMDVILNGTYKPAIPAVTFNFVLRGVGPICRLCVNGTMHKNAGRSHKHELLQDDDPRLNLPTAIARPDLEGKSVKEIWETLCQQAGIMHTGKFIAPAGGAA